ncbi:MAG: hypothetical protein HOO06_04745 [Bdellovibrionaceae bacterium]|nr:hypothetical protein [Pseudobdellovibrionaceae bacterium]
MIRGFYFSFIFVVNGTCFMPTLLASSTETSEFSNEIQYHQKRYSDYLGHEKRGLIFDQQRRSNAAKYKKKKLLLLKKAEESRRQHIKNRKTVNSNFEGTYSEYLKKEQVRAGFQKKKRLEYIKNKKNLNRIVELHNKIPLPDELDVKAKSGF